MLSRLLGPQTATETRLRKVKYSINTDLLLCTFEPLTKLILRIVTKMAEAAGERKKASFN